MVIAGAIQSANPNVIYPALFAFGGATVTAMATIAVVVLSNRSTRTETKRVHKQFETNHGHTPGEYLEMIGQIRDFTVQHAKDDNEIRRELGLKPGHVPHYDEVEP